MAGKKNPFVFDQNKALVFFLACLCSALIGASSALFSEVFFERARSPVFGPPVVSAAFVKVFDEAVFGEDVSEIVGKAGRITSGSVNLYAGELYVVYYHLTNVRPYNVTVFDEGVYCWWSDEEDNETFEPEPFDMGPYENVYLVAYCRAPLVSGIYPIELRMETSEGDFNRTVLFVNIVGGLEPGYVEPFWQTGM